MRQRNVWIVGVGVAAGALAARAVSAQDIVVEGSLDEISRDLVVALDEACTHPELRDKALESPDFLLDLAGTSLPEGFELGTFRLDEYWFEPRYPTIELTHCRRVWVCEPTETLELELAPCEWTEEEICLGLRVVEASYPWGPYTPK